MKHFAFILLFLSLPLWALGQENHLKVELLSETATLVPGKPATFGLHFTMDNGWHIYWQNPGDAGLAPSVNWKLPIGFKAGKILWPLPKRISLPSVMDFGYENEVTLLVPIQVPRTVHAGETFNLTANVQWLVCKETCIPGQAALPATLTIGDGKGPADAWITQARSQLPEKQPKTWKPSGTLDGKQFVLSFPTGTTPTSVVFFPLQSGQVDNNAAQIFQPNDKGFSLTLKRSDLLTQNVQKLEGLLVVTDHDVKKGYEVKVPLSSNR